jgi:alkylation response protein AidB-like acyl-CoA dehydrogenase
MIAMDLNTIREVSDWHPRFSHRDSSHNSGKEASRMIDFSLDEEQRAIQESARRFTEREVTPIAHARDRSPDHQDCFQWDIVEKLSQVGFRTLTLNEKYGGPGASSLTTAIVCEELAVGDLGVSAIVAQCAKLVQVIQWTAPEEICRKFLIPFRDDERYLIATCSTEAEAGSDILAGGIEARIATTAVLDGDEWVINGTKQWSTGSSVAKLYRVLVRLEDGNGYALVPSDTPGLTVDHVNDKMGERLYPNAGMAFDNVRIPRDDMIPAPNGSAAPDMRSRFMRASNAYAAACNVGIARAAYEAALEYAKTRVQGGRRLIEQQLVGATLADMYAGIEAARLLCWKAAWAADNDEFYDPKLHAMAKVVASETAKRVSVQALEIHGGYGAMRDLPLEKYVRDAVGFSHSDGTNQVLRVKTLALLADEA